MHMLTRFLSCHHLLPDLTRSDLTILCIILSPHLSIMPWIPPLYHTSLLFSSFSFFLLFAFPPFFLVKVHAYIIHYLKKQMPYVIGKSEKQKKLLDRLDRCVCVCVCVCVRVIECICECISVTRNVYVHVCVRAASVKSQDIVCLLLFIIAATSPDNLSLLNTSIFYLHPSSHSASNQCPLL